MKNTLIFKTLKDFNNWRSSLLGSLGFVPTMGALHQGHGELLQKAREENDFVVLSVFVNKTQFNDLQDYSKYPTTEDEDILLAKNKGVDVILFPTFEEIYPDGYHYRIHEDSLSKELCGAHRPGHFDGVLTVVMKLFQITRPQRVYFGEKDYQQLLLIKKMIQAFFLPIELVSVPTVRELDGLAMSSRNRRLSPQERTMAPKFYSALQNSSTAEKAREILEEEGFVVDYIVDKEGRRFGAVSLGSVRLIDNTKFIK